MSGDIIKVISLTQPWATLCAISTPDEPAKDIETRSWSTSYRGPLGIHAAKGFPKWAQALCDEEPFKSRLCGLKAKDLPRGVLLCVRSLEKCVSTDGVIGPTRKMLPILFKENMQPITWMEQQFGDYSDGRYAWFLGPVTRVFDPPFPVMGALGLWNLRLP